MIHFPVVFLITVVSAVALRGGATALAGEIELFYSDFEHHSEGDDQLVGTDGWLGTSLGTGSHGIDFGLVPGLGQLGFLGSAQPSGTFVSVLRKVDFDPLASAAPVMRFEAFIGIEDSTNGRRDSFFLTIRNIMGQVLANLRFHNGAVTPTIPILRLDGSGQQFTTGLSLIRGQLHFIWAEIDFATNRWSASVDGIPVFAGEGFHAGARTLDFGSVAAEWQLSAASPSEFGDNFMIFDEWTITAVEAGVHPFEIVSIEISPGGGRRITWIADPDFTYQVEYSDDLASWKNDLPGSFVSGVGARGAHTYEDTTVPPAAGSRCYRVVRVYQP